jgi:hypothetical protein
MKEECHCEEIVGAEAMQKGQLVRQVLTPFASTFFALLSCFDIFMNAYLQVKWKDWELSTTPGNLWRTWLAVNNTSQSIGS